MNNDEREVVRECLQKINTNLVLYYDYIPSVTAGHTILMKGKPITVFELLQFIQEKMNVTGEVQSKLDLLLKNDEPF